MNYNQASVIAKQKNLRSIKRKLLSKFKLGLMQFFLLFLTGFCAIGLFAGIGIYKGLIDTAPDIDSIDVIPQGYATTIYDSNGRAIQKLVGSDANRIYKTIDEIPEDVQNAFVAIEDSRFWEHSGIDIKGIFRATVSGITSSEFDQGASTLTQQLLKNQVFNGGNEVLFFNKVQRKIQEQYLAVQLENQLDKKTILEYYLNTINLGQNTLGVQAASNRYFDKDVSELTISEAAVIAGITQNPSAYNPITHPKDNEEKRAIVLKYMLEQKYISNMEYDEALSDPVYKRIASVNKQYSDPSSKINSYFVDALIDEVIEDLKEDLGYTETQATNAIYRGGLEIYTTQNRKIQKVCNRILNDDSYFPYSTSQLSYQLSIESEDGKIKNYNEQTLKAYYRQSDSSFDIYFSDKKEAKKLIRRYRKTLVGETDTIIGENINFVVQPQISFVLMEQGTGQVQAIVGGRGKKTANRTLNRATGSLRQPGSTFKILSTYVPALDTSGMTLATVQDDSEYYYPNTNTQVRNWSGSSYNGLTSLREGIVSSMNIVTVKTFEQVTPQIGYDYLLNLGFTTLVDTMTDSQGNTYSDIQLPTALGGLTEGVTNLELTAAFASIANGGLYTEPVFYTKILDHDGNVLIDKTPDTRQVMKDSTAWLLTDAMKDVVSRGTGTATRFDALDMPVAGKTGTTSKDIDLWFVGYTPYYTAGIWGGYDLNERQSSTTYHKYIWKTIMQSVHTELELPVTDFTKPDSIVSAYICTKCGKLAVDGLCEYAAGGSCAKTEYFAKGSVPDTNCDCHVRYTICSASGRLATEHCPDESVSNKVYLTKEETGPTKDTSYILPANLSSSYCNIHTGESSSITSEELAQKPIKETSEEENEEEETVEPEEE